MYFRNLMMMFAFIVPIGGVGFIIFNYVHQEIGGDPFENAMKIEDKLEGYIGKDLDEMCVVSASFNKYIIGDKEEGKQYHLYKSFSGEIGKTRDIILANETKQIIPGEEIDSTLSVIDGEVERTNLKFNGFISNEYISLTSMFGQIAEEYKVSIQGESVISVDGYDVEIEILDSDPSNNVLTANLSKNVCAMH